MTTEFILNSLWHKKSKTPTEVNTWTFFGIHILLKFKGGVFHHYKSTKLQVGAMRGSQFNLLSIYYIHYE
jgi:hypothetical protein